MDDKALAKVGIKSETNDKEKGISCNIVIIIIRKPNRVVAFCGDERLL